MSNNRQLLLFNFMCESKVGMFILSFLQVDFGYDDGAENLVLRKLDLTIDPGVKVGIVGRTGAGKTSMIAALLRLHELKSGRIRIDDVDVAKIGLRDLRSAVAVIPQDPVLFQGTICVSS